MIPALIRGVSCLAVVLLLVPRVALGASDSTDVGGVVPTETAEQDRRLGEAGLKRCLGLAERQFPKIREAVAKRDQKASAASVVRLAPFSEFSLSGGLILAPTVSGTSEYSQSTDTALTRNMGLAWSIGVDGAIPLYTFGKMTNAVDASEAAVRVSNREIDKERNDVRLNVRKAYFGVLLARDALALVRDALKELERQIDKMNKAIAEGEGDDIALLKLKLYLADLKGKQSEAEKQETIALAALTFLTGGGKTPEVPDVPLYAELHELGALHSYLERARAQRPELAMVRAAIEARTSQVKLETSKFFPDLGIGLTAKWTRAPEVTDQSNPFVKDTGNFTTIAGGLILKQKLDFAPQAFRVSQARAQVAEAIATEQWARSGIVQQVTEAYAEVRDSRVKLSYLTESTRLAKQWLVKVQQGIEVGTMDDEDIVEPAKEYALKKYAEMLATYEFNVALAKLMQTTGSELPVGGGP